ncbi:MAG: M56 family metallopeptidase [Ferruginibacter sp.]
MLLFSIQISGQQLIHAINWTLIHSLWQGVLLSLVAGIIILATKKTSSLLRYNLLTVALFVFIISVLANFSLQIIKEKKASDISVTTIAAKTILENNVEVSVLSAENKSSFSTRATVFFNKSAGWIILVWALIIFLQCIRLAAGMYGVHQLKKTEIFSAGDFWDARIIALCRDLKMNTNVRLLQSGIAQVPLVAGFFKPVILFPLAMLASLPPNEVEAILIHELAHIRRKDMLVNMVQHFVEIFFFFNPAVLWVSSLIKLERENCCDDVAINKVSNKRNYIAALLSFQEMNAQQSPALAQAFSTDKHHLLNRIKRILFNNNKTLNSMEKKFLAAGAVITGICILAFTTNNVEQKKSPVKTGSASTITQSNSTTQTSIDTMPANKEVMTGRISTNENGKKYELVTENNTVKELYVNGEKITADKMADYDKVTSKILQQSKIDREQSEKDIKQSQIELEQSKKEMAQSQIEMEQSKKEMEQHQIEMEQSKKDMAQSQIEMKQSKKEMAQAKIEMEKRKDEMMKVSSTDMVQQKKEMEQAQIEMKKAQKEMEGSQRQMKIDMENSQKDMARSAKDLERSRKEVAASQMLSEGIINDLIENNIIKSKKDLSSYTLNNDELIVNGIKQPDTVYKKFSGKYIKKGKRTISYSNDEK